MASRIRQPEIGENAKKTKGAGGEEEGTPTTAAAVPRTKEQRIVALEAELDEVKTELVDAKASLKKWSDLLEKAIAGEEGHKEKEAKYEKQKADALRRVEALEGTVKDLKAELAILRETSASSILAYENALQFEETSFPPRVHFDYITPTFFEAILDQTVRSMVETAQRDQVYYVLTGPMGVGKSRAGHELVKRSIEKVPASLAALDMAPRVWKQGYLRSASSLPLYEESEAVRKNDEECFNVLAHSLVRSLCPAAETIPPQVSFKRISAKIKQSLGCQGIVLHVDEFAANPFAVMMMMRACALTAIEPKGTLRVHMIVTGVRSLLNMYPLAQGSRYFVEYKTLPALGYQALNESIATQLGFSSTELFDMCTRLHNLIIDCGGFPAFIERLVVIIKESTSVDPSLLEGLLKRGNLDVTKAKLIYEKLVASLTERYNEAAWANMTTVKGGNKNHMSLPTRTMLRRIALDAITAAPIQVNSTIVYQKEAHAITYGDAETSGLVAVSDNKVVLPLLAISIMNEYLNVVDGYVLRNPFVYGFEVHEQLALVSLLARLRRMNFMQIRSCTLKELRPGAHASGDHLNLVLSVPDCPQEDIAIITTGSFFEKSVGDGVRAGAEDKDGRVPVTPGTLLMAAEGQKSVNGALYLEGTYSSGKCHVLILSQSKWSQLYNPGTTSSSTSTMTTGAAQDILDRMEKMREAVMESWFGGRKQGEEWFFIYDVFSDHTEGEQLNVQKVELSPMSALVVTTEATIQTVVGPVLGLRARLKRLAEDEGEAISRKRQQQ